MNLEQCRRLSSGAKPLLHETSLNAMLQD